MEENLEEANPLLGVPVAVRGREHDVREARLPLVGRKGRE
jgi:hypothetical protein